MELKQSLDEEQINHGSKSPGKKEEVTPLRSDYVAESPMTYGRKEGTITPSIIDDNAEEEENEQVVMRMELAIELADTAQPTREEIKEYESFSSKFIIV